MLARRVWHCVLLVFHLLYTTPADFATSGQQQDRIRPSTDLVRGENDSLLVLSTLNGSLIGISRNTGEIKWRVNNEPAVKVPLNTANAIVPIFLPDPKDGSLYLMKVGESNVLKKLPFSIQHLVSSSPCKSNDGIFYTGKKVDTWFSVDWITGKKTSLLSFDSSERTCPLSSSNSLFIGRTEYSIMMYDSMRQNRHWNVTFYDYSSRMLSTEELKNYEFIHIGGSASGRVKTLDRSSGTLIWEKDFGSPLVALYMRQANDIIALPFSTIADDTLSSIPFYLHEDKLLLTLFIGEHKHGLYALPSLAGRDLPLLPAISRPARLLIEGPNTTKTENQIILLGHYKVPDTSKTLLQIAGRSDPVILLNNTSHSTGEMKQRTGNRGEEYSVNQRLANGSVEFQLLSIIVAGLAVTLVAMFLYFRAKVRDIQLSSQGSSQSSSYGNSTATDDAQYGIITVGKISFNTQYILGKGCEGTFVFRGEFDGRKVAVKRLLPDCFTVADREVCLLRESDAHPNVVRYFCMEQDTQFRYIALELCSATVQGYVEKDLHRDEISPTDLLKQASMGLAHLHSLNIVHRDIKPHNILLSVNCSQVRAMISDFGLCKKLQNGRMSFSRRSGITGTDGWIAPEMIESSGRTMCAVDIFSLGCVFYYVLSNGKHPFGEPIRRQANILSGEYRLLDLENELWKMLIEKMISQDPLDRPSIDVVKIHPVFWKKSVILTFLQDVSDRVEKEDMESDVVCNLERGGIRAIGGADWRDLIDSEVAEDLRKYRSYKGNSVRDLLRAIRNKKHHYRELSGKAQKLLGSDSESYVDYWTSHFPVLLDHTWAAMQSIKGESAFRHYYHSTYHFPTKLLQDDGIPLLPMDTASETAQADEGWGKMIFKTPETARRNWFNKNSPGAWKSPRGVRFRVKRKEKKEDEMGNLVWRVHEKPS